MNNFNTENHSDSRVQRTQRDLFKAFASLVLNQRYDAISVNDIIEQAGIARSTFYQHYRNKDDLLVSSMSGMLHVFAAAAIGQGKRDALRQVVEHLWENRSLGRIILSGPPYQLITTRLTVLIEAGLSPTETLRTPARLKAIQLANGQFAMLRAWLTGKISCHTDDLIDSLLHSDDAHAYS